jgi:aspartyl-tRNA synthetase
MKARGFMMSAQAPLIRPNPYRTVTCADLRLEHVGQDLMLAGWVHRMRDHGGLLFIDLRDHFGITQCVFASGSEAFKAAEQLRNESVVSFKGKVVKRAEGTQNDKLPTGAVELKVEAITLLSAAENLPLQVNSDEPYGEETRLKYRFLDLRRDVMQKNIKLRCDMIASLRRRMWDQHFREFQTPILTASSPEGARDFLVPSRLHAGKFYALPQAPQQFKQLLMMSGFDRYFQIAPCFRDEDARADRTAGEFYQLDVEMSFVTQEDIFAVMEDVIGGVFTEFASVTGKTYQVSKAPFVRIPYDVSMLKYGNDKPDLRNPLEIVDVTSVFKRDDVTFQAFKGMIDKGGVVRAIKAPKVSDRPRSFFDKLNDWARGEGAVGLGYVLFEGDEGKGPIAKFIPSAALTELKALISAEAGDAVFFVCDDVAKAAPFAGKARTKIGEEMNVIDETQFIFCWITDYPMFEINDKTGKIDFSHNPFSMPAGGLHALNTQDPLTIKAIQYDCVLNGVELASGGIRNHVPEAMERAFEIAGYPREAVREKFGGMYNAFTLGAPPHGGCAFGIDRMVMFLANEPNVREVIAFPMNQKAEDLLMAAPSEATAQQLKDVHIKLDLPKDKMAKAG